MVELKQFVLGAVLLRIGHPAQPDMNQRGEHRLTSARLFAIAMSDAEPLMRVTWEGYAFAIYNARQNRTQGQRRRARLRRQQPDRSWDRAVDGSIGCAGPRGDRKS